MKLLVSMAAVALSTVLLMPLGVAAQAESQASSEVAHASVEPSAAPSLVLATLLPVPFSMPRWIETDAGTIAVEMGRLDEPWYHTAPLRKLLAPMGKDLSDVQFATAGRVESPDNGWVSEMQTIRVQDVAPESLLLPLLNTVGSGFSERVLELRTERVVDGHPVSVLTVPGAADGFCIIYSITGEVLVMSAWFGCDVEGIAPAQAAVGEYLAEVWH